MNKEKVIELLKKYGQGTLDNEEKALLETWYLRQAANSKQRLSPEMLEKSFESIKSRLPVKSADIRPVWSRLLAAASIFIVFSLSAYFLLQTSKNFQQTVNPKTTILPGGNNATLTLADGKQIILTGAKNGRILTGTNMVINKTADGSLLYRSKETAGQDMPTEYNILSTPRGGQYHLTLADGTNLWLNSASSIKYPVAFTGTYREVEITGEAYFEVAHDSKRPFKVMSGTQVIQVLGTHFNINAYNDELSVKTTLLEGSVKVTQQANGETILLKPGQQSLLSAAGIKIESANIEESMAWKNGYFRFNNEKIETIMRQLSRWYNIDVEYRGDITDERFYGTISRYKNINEVLEIIQQTKGVHFKIEGRRIIITG